MAKLVRDRLPQSAAYLLVAAQQPPLVEARDKTPMGLKKTPSTRRTPAPYSALGTRVGAIWLWNAPLQTKL